MNAMDTIKSLVMKLENNPIVKKIEEHERKQLVERRTAAAEKIEALEIKKVNKLRELQEDVKVKQTAFDEAKRAYDTARGELGTAQRQKFGTSIYYDRLIGQQKDILIESADSIIDQAIDWFQDKLDWLRSSGRITSQTITKKNLVNLRAVISTI